MQISKTFSATSQFSNVFKCMYTVIRKNSQVGRCRSIGREAMLIRFDITLIKKDHFMKIILSNNLAMLLILAIGL